MMADDCPICCEPFSQADHAYPLHCPTPTCAFNFCCNCVTSIQKSAADGYQEASDGSRQLKVQVQCPQCRGRYVCATYSSTSNNAIVPAVLLMRQASVLEAVVSTKDSDLSATELATKHQFCQSWSLRDLKDALETLETYHYEIGKNIGRSSLATLDWESWAHALPEQASGNNMSCLPSCMTGDGAKHPSSVEIDPSLFLGLDEFVTRDEQVFVHNLLTSGDVQGLVQAAQILQSILQLAQSGTATIQSASTKTPVELQSLRERFPLPARMPRSVNLPVYDPMAKYKLLKFDNKNTLEIASLHHGAGKLGLRKRDVVTHLEGEAILDYDAFVSMLQAYYEQDPETSLALVVNADKETAQALQRRSQTIICASTRRL
jgi:hypothetical protein